MFCSIRILLFFGLNTPFFHFWQSLFRIVRQTVTGEQISETYVERIGGRIVLVFNCPAAQYKQS
jgi:hypothetical protein